MERGAEITEDSTTEVEVGMVELMMRDLFGGLDDN